MMKHSRSKGHRTSEPTSEKVGPSEFPEGLFSSPTHKEAVLKSRWTLITLVLASAFLARLAADEHPAGRQSVQPGDAEEETALDVISDHERTSVAYEIFGRQFTESLDGGQRIALFVPADEFFEGTDHEALTTEEIVFLYLRHMSTGLVSLEPIETVDTFMTADGRLVTVTIDAEGRIVLNGVAAVLEAIPAANGIVYILDNALDS